MISKMMTLMNSTRRNQIKQAVLSALEPIYGYCMLPVPLKHIIKCHKNIVLVSYSRFMKAHHLSYAEMLEYAGSIDAFTDCLSSDSNPDNKYIIHYNDIEESIISSNRYRWNIAHELGHIFLGHHTKYPQTRLFRNSVDSSLYHLLEDEADQFAAYILVPHSVLLMHRISTSQDIASLCRISGHASRYRMTNYSLWYERKQVEPYDHQILNAFSYYIDESVRHLIIQDAHCVEWIEKHHTCPKCGTFHGDQLYKFCPICGHENILSNWGGKQSAMIYNGIELNPAGKCCVCPTCKNEQPHDKGDFCIVCGQIIVNRCSSFDCSHHEPLPGNARYCPYCGNETTFLLKKILSPWNSIDNLDIDLNGDDDVPF